MKAYAPFFNGQCDCFAIRESVDDVEWAVKIALGKISDNRRAEYLKNVNYEVREIEITWDGENETKKEE